jgi:hypothetical protein
MPHSQKQKQEQTEALLKWITDSINPAMDTRTKKRIRRTVLTILGIIFAAPFAVSNYRFGSQVIAQNLLRIQNKTIQKILGTYFASTICIVAILFYTGLTEEFYQVIGRSRERPGKRATRNTTRTLCKTANVGLTVLSAVPLAELTRQTCATTLPVWLVTSLTSTNLIANFWFNYYSASLALNGIFLSRFFDATARSQRRKLIELVTTNLDLIQQADARGLSEFSQLEAETRLSRFFQEPQSTKKPITTNTTFIPCAPHRSRFKSFLYKAGERTTRALGAVSGSIAPLFYYRFTEAAARRICEDYLQIENATTIAIASLTLGALSVCMRSILWGNAFSKLLGSTYQSRVNPQEKTRPATPKTKRDKHFTTAKIIGCAGILAPSQVAGPYIAYETLKGLLPLIINILNSCNTCAAVAPSTALYINNLLNSIYETQDHHVADSSDIQYQRRQLIQTMLTLIAILNELPPAQILTLYQAMITEPAMRTVELRSVVTP